MTTTGGPDSVTEPVTVEQLDGDDIEVVPDAPPVHRRRARFVVVGAVVVVVLAAGIGIAVALTRDNGPTTVRAIAPVTPQRTPAPSHAPRSKPNRPVVHEPPASIAPLTPASPPPSVAVPPPPVAPTQPPVTSPPVSPASVLQWSSTPAALTIPAGGHATLTVHVVNPSDGTVTLGHPLSCPPTLRGPKGHVIGYSVCTEMAQLIAPHEQFTQRYVVYATDTAAPGGGALAPGVYTASVENLFAVTVTVTPS